MRTLTVAGTCSGVGKTTLICRLLEDHPDWGVLKISTHPAGHRGHGGRQGAEALATDPETLSRPGSATARYVAAGARRVAWLRPTPEYLPHGLGPALESLEGVDGVLIEGNSHLLHRPSDRVVLVARPGLDDVKPSAWRILDRVDCLVFNRALEHARPGYDPAVLATVRSRFDPDDVLDADFGRDAREALGPLRKRIATWFPR